MSQKNDSAGLDVYVPMILIAAFLIGCFAVGLVSVRENAEAPAPQSEAAQNTAEEGQGLRRKSAVKKDGDLRYRWVSPVDYGYTDLQAVEAAANAGVSSEESDGDSALKLPNAHYINFTPPKEGRVAYLTFDDGPSSNTEDILDILDYYNVKATFFVIYHANMEQQYQDIVNRGHTIALHTYTHDYSKIYKSETAFFDDMEEIGNYVYSVTGVSTKIIRFPGGSSNTVSNHYCKNIMKTLKVSVPRNGYIYHDWNVDSGDASTNNLAPDKMLDNVKTSLTKYRKPDVLMHDAGENKRTTVEALPQIIEYIYAQGYKMERLEEDSYAVHHNW